MLRPGELEIAANAPRERLLSGCRSAVHPLARHASLRKFQRRLLVAPQAPAPALLQSLLPIAAGPTISATKSRENDRALELLDWWECELDDCYDGRPSHPVFVALRETIVAKNIPKQPFVDLLRAFRQDQTVKRYPTWDSMIGYCVYSANPVGRLVLYLCGYRDEERQTTVRRHLHRPPARQFLARRQPRSRKRPHLHSSRRRRGPRPHRNRHRRASFRSIATST